MPGSLSTSTAMVCRSIWSVCMAARPNGLLPRDAGEVASVASRRGLRPHRKMVSSGAANTPSTMLRMVPLPRFAGEEPLMPTAQSHQHHALFRDRLLRLVGRAEQHLVVGGP